MYPFSSVPVCPSLLSPWPCHRYLRPEVCWGDPWCHVPILCTDSLHLFHNKGKLYPSLKYGKISNIIPEESWKPYTQFVLEWWPEKSLHYYTHKTKWMWRAIEAPVTMLSIIQSSVLWPVVVYQSSKLKGLYTKGKGWYSSSWEPHHRATGRHFPYGIIQSYLPPDTSERSAPKPKPCRLVLDLPIPEG